MAILATVGTVSFLGYRNKNRLKLTGDEISSMLRTVHDRAVSQEEGTSWGVKFVNDNNTNYYYVVFYGNGAPPSGITSTVKYLDGSLKFNLLATNSATTTIFSQLTGNTTSTAPMTVQVAMRSDTNTSTTISVYPNGRVEY